MTVNAAATHLDIDGAAFVAFARQPLSFVAGGGGSAAGGAKVASIGAYVEVKRPAGSRVRAVVTRLVNADTCDVRLEDGTRISGFERGAMRLAPCALGRVWVAPGAGAWSGAGPAPTIFATSARKARVVGADVRAGTCAVRFDDEDGDCSADTHVSIEEELWAMEGEGDAFDPAQARRGRRALPFLSLAPPSSVLGGRAHQRMPRRVLRGRAQHKGVV